MMKSSYTAACLLFSGLLLSAASCGSPPTAVASTEGDATEDSSGTDDAPGPECGNGILEEGESCDLGLGSETVETPECPVDCGPPRVQWLWMDENVLGKTFNISRAGDSSALIMDGWRGEWDGYFWGAAGAHSVANIWWIDPATGAVSREASLPGVRYATPIVAIDDGTLLSEVLQVSPEGSEHAILRLTAEGVPMATVLPHPSLPSVEWISLAPQLGAAQPQGWVIAAGQYPAAAEPSMSDILVIDGTGVPLVVAAVEPKRQLQVLSYSARADGSQWSSGLAWPGRIPFLWSWSGLEGDPPNLDLLDEVDLVAAYGSPEPGSLDGGESGIWIGDIHPITGDVLLFSSQSELAEPLNIIRIPSDGSPVTGANLPELRGLQNLPVYVPGWASSAVFVPGGYAVCGLYNSGCPPLICPPSEVYPFVNAGSLDAFIAVYDEDWQLRWRWDFGGLQGQFAPDYFDVCNDLLVDWDEGTIYANGVTTTSDYLVSPWWAKLRL